MSLNETISAIKSNVADIGFKTMYGKTAKELVEDMISKITTPISFQEFMVIARQAKALDVLETWDENTFNAYTEEFGPMTKETAIDLCYFLEAVSQEEQAAGEYFSRR